MKIVIRDIDSTLKWNVIETNDIDKFWGIKSVVKKKGLYNPETCTQYNYHSYQLVGIEPNTIFEIIVTPEDCEE